MIVVVIVVIVAVEIVVVVVTVRVIQLWFWLGWVGCAVVAVLVLRQHSFSVVKGPGYDSDVMFVVTSQNSTPRTCVGQTKNFWFPISSPNPTRFWSRQWQC